ncbi:MAG: peptidoglycan -binding protein [Aquisalimonadaceae bacterium]
MDIWPGYVDALATLLLLFVFVLTLFMVAQFVLTDALTGRDRALERLQAQLSSLSDSLTMERRQRASLEEELAVTVSERDDLRQQLSDALTDSERLMAELEGAGRTMEEQLFALASLQQDIDALRQLREELEDRVGELAAALDESEQSAEAVRDRSLTLEARLSDAQERTRLAQRELEDRETRVRDLRTLTEEQRQAIEEERELSAEQLSRIDQLNQQVSALREQLRRVSAALELSESTVAEQDVEIEELGRQLNLALVERVQELNLYRSEFFGRLREILGDREDIRIVGDRFLFQSELFFESASAELGQDGRRQLNEVAGALLEISERIPTDLPWVLQVEGHTDRRAISTEEFPSNWQLSSARAQSIVDYLISQGVPPNRLSATGFAEFHPVDDSNTEQALRRNRRIEMRLTSR